MLEIKYVPIDSITPSSNNPRIIKDEQFKILCESIKNNPDYFEARPILVNKSMTIFAGNMRFLASKEVGLTQVPVAIMDVSPERENELMLRDNIQNGQWNWDMLAQNDTDFLLGLGLTESDLGISVDKTEMPQVAEDIPPVPTTKCPKCGHEFVA